MTTLANTLFCDGFALSYTVKVLPMASKSKVSIDKVAAVIPALQPRRRPRGRAFATGNEYGFKKDDPRIDRSGGKPRVFQKFSAAVMERMLQPVPKEVKKKLGLGRGATMYDAMVKALLLQAASGDTTAFTTARETVEGRLVQRNVNISASLQALQDDPKFVEWLENKHADYLMEAGPNGRKTFEEATWSLPSATDAASVPED